MARKAKATVKVVQPDGSIKATSQVPKRNDYRIINPDGSTHYIRMDARARDLARRVGGGGAE